MSFFDFLLPAPKMWDVYGHRVEELTKTVGPPGATGNLRTKVVYRCADCHKEFSNREDFKHEKCYDVI